MRQLPKRWTATAQKPCSKGLPSWVRRSPRRGRNRPTPGGVLLRYAPGRALRVGHARALADEVDDAAGGDVPAAPAGAEGAQAEVGLLEVKEVAVVHEPDVVEDGAADEHAGPGDPVGGVRPVLDR